MEKLRFQVSVVMMVGFLALVAGFCAHLALTDIYHGEQDAALEWRVVQLAALIILVFIGSALVMFGRILKLIRVGF